MGRPRSRSLAEDSPFEGGLGADEMRAPGVHAVMTPEECVELMRQTEMYDCAINFKPLTGPPELGWTSLELFANKVVPMLQSAA